jgi:hypothetical protein
LIITDGFLADDRLHVSGSIPKSQEMKLAAVTTAAQPASKSDFLSYMLCRGIYRHHRHCLSSSEKLNSTGAD